METVLIDEVVEFLETQRDQSLWYSIISNMNYDYGEPVSHVAEWMLQQDDCDVAIAVLAYSLMSGEYFCGVQHETECCVSVEFLKPLRIIEARETTRPFKENALKVPKRDLYLFDQSEMLEISVNAAARLASSQGTGTKVTGLISVPENLLKTELKGTVPLSSYVAFDTGPMVVPIGQ